MVIAHPHYRMTGSAAGLRDLEERRRKYLSVVNRLYKLSGKPTRAHIKNGSGGFLAARLTGSLAAFFVFIGSLLLTRWSIGEPYFISPKSKLHGGYENSNLRSGSTI